MPLEAVGASGDLGVEHGGRGVAEEEVGHGDDALGDAARAVFATGALGGDALDELSLADVAHLAGAVGAVHCAALDEDGGDDVMSGVDVSHDFVEEVAVAGAFPEVVVRVADGKTGVDGLLDDAGQPGVSVVGHG